jgi:hypothetical protein
MSSNVDHRCLIVALRSELTLVENVSWPIEHFRLFDATYRNVGLGEWTGFYDWLRRSNGELVGVRYCPLADNDPLFEAVRGLPYIRIASRCLEIYFSGVAEVDGAQSCDQEFLYDPVFRSDSGAWAIAFDTTALKDTDLTRLRQPDATWRTGRISQVS